MPLRYLTTEQVVQFQVNGFLTVEDLLSDNEVAALAAHTDQIAAGDVDHIPDSSTWFEEGDGTMDTTDAADVSGQKRVLSVFKLFNLAVYDEKMWRHVTHPKLVAAVSDLLGTEDIKMYGDQLFMKPPEKGSAVPWHQDSASWCDIFPMDLVTAWAAIDHADQDNGCLRFVPATHRWGMLVGKSPGQGIYPEQAEPLDQDIGSERWPIVPVPLRPGSVSFHHSLILHSSAPNTSDRRRRGYAVHYMRATAWQNPAVDFAPKMPPFKQVSGRSYPGRV